MCRSSAAWCSCSEPVEGTGGTARAAADAPFWPRRIRRVLRLLVHTSARTSDASSDTLIAIASALKNAPVTPVIVMSGRKTTIGVSVDPISGTVSSLRALAVACSGPSPPSRCSTMFSTTTILSSMTRPTAAARPPSVIRLKVWPRIFITMNVTTIVTGTTSPVITAVPQSRRNSQMISPARNNPMMMASRTLAIDSVTMPD